MAASVAAPNLPPATCSPQKALADMAHEPSAKTHEPLAESPYLPLEPQDDVQETAEASAAPPVESEAASAETIVAADAPAKSKSSSKSKSSAKKKKKAGSGSGSSGSSKKKKKKGLENTSGAPCIGLYVDALDLKMLWGEAQIIDCNIEEKKLKVHFIGWKSSYDIWTDRMSLARHGAFVPLTKKSIALRRRWDGKSNLFSETEAQNEEPDGDLSVPLLTESPLTATAEESSSGQQVEASAAAPLAVVAPPSAAEAAAPVVPDVPAAKVATAKRKVRPSKIVIEKAAAKEAAAALVAMAPKRSPPSKSERGGAAVTAITKVSPAAAAKVTTPSSTVAGKKRTKSPVVKTSSSSSADAAAAATAATANGVVPAASSSRSHKRLKESVELQPANGAASVDFAAARKQNVADDAQTASFLQRCASVWQRQLSAVTSRQS